MAESNSGGHTPPDSLPSRRQRAPTITIDTSAVSPPADHALGPPRSLSNRKQAATEGQNALLGQGDDPPPASPPINSSAAELRPSRSFDSRDSRPTSPHNVSSPTQLWAAGPHSFLSVPSSRPRGDSVDSEDLTHSPVSYGGDTHTPSPASSRHGEHSRQPSTVHSTDNLINNGEALRADPGTEPDFEVAGSPFAFSRGQLNKLLNPKSPAAFHVLGGLRGLEKGLRTNRHAGLSVGEKRLEGTVTFEDAITMKDGEVNPTAPSDRRMARTDPLLTEQPSEDPYFDRKRIFASNVLPERKVKTIFELVWLAYNDKVLILLSVAAVISLALGIYQSVTATAGQARVAWVEGVAIVIAIAVVVVVGATNDWKKERQFVKLNRKKEARDVRVIRSGKSREISVSDVLVGDVMHLEPGDLIPVDGIFISGYNVKCDESSATGESDVLKKTPADELFRAIEAHENIGKQDPFIISGGKVTEGVGTFLVTSVGVNSSHGKTMMSLSEESQTTPLQSKLNILAEYIAKLGLAAGLLLFVVTFIEFCVRLGSFQGGADAKGQAFLRVFIVAVTVIVVAVPEGLPLAVTLALAFATTQMLKDNNLVRRLRACETMGNATVICSDKTGTLTQNKMSVVAGTVSTGWAFGGQKPSPRPPSPAPPKPNDPAHPLAHDASVAEAIDALDEGVRAAIKESIAINSTAFEGGPDGEELFIGSKTETALLGFARDYLDMRALGEERSAADIVQLVPFDSRRKCMATAVKTCNGKFRLYVKGASEIMLAKCRRILLDPTKGMEETAMTEEKMAWLDRVIANYGSRSLRTIGLVYKDFEQWPPKGYPTRNDDPKSVVFDKVFKDMTFLAVIGIRDSLRPGVAEAVRACQNAGVVVRMVTGDNLLTAKAIAEECGIYTAGGLVMEGPEFRKLGKRQMSQTIPQLQVLARSSPEDKRILVKRLMEMGETVAVTGDGTNDAPALKTADVGFSMGIAGTEVAKEASDIILMDDDFASIVKAIMWGRSVNDAVRKFLQVTVNITAVVLTFISAVSSVDETSVLTAVQLLWVNLIMDTFAALALATDAPTASILNRKPEPKSAPLINLSMWKMIIGQSIYQLAVSLLLFFGGSSVFGYRLPDDQPRLQTFIFNAFVWMQIFNQYNCRCLDNRFNIFEGMWRNSFFLGIQIAIVGGQLLIVFFGGAAFSVTPLNAVEWAYSVGLGAVSLPVAILVRLIPDGFLSHLLPDFLNRKTTPRLVVSDEERQFQWNPALEEIREELALLKLLRGGRLNILKYKLHHPREFLPRSRSGSRSPNRSMPQTPVNEPATELGSPGPPTPGSQRSLTRRRSRSRSNSAFGPAAAMAGIVAGSIGGWSHMERRDGDEGIGLFVPLHDSRGRDAPASPDIQPRTESNDPVPTDPFSTLSDPPYPPQVAAPSPSSSSGLAPPPIHLGLAPPPVPSSQGSGLSHRPHASA